MTTEAGKRLLDAIFDMDGGMPLDPEALVAAIEAEAFENGRLSVVQDGTKDAWVAAALAEAAERVRGLPDDCHSEEGSCYCGTDFNPDTSIDRAAAVLAILEER